MKKTIVSSLLDTAIIVVIAALICVVGIAMYLKYQHPSLTETQIFITIFEDWLL